MFIERQFDTGAAILNYAEGEGGRPPLVLLHGMSLWWKYFLPVLPHFAIRWHTYALDLRGHGKSSHVPQGYEWPAIADDCRIFLEQQVREPAVLLGHSLGGMAAIQVAATCPELVRALVLEDPPLCSYRRRGRGADRNFVQFRDLAASDLSIGAITAELTSSRPERDAVWPRLRARSLILLDPDALTMEFDGRAKEHYDVDKLLPAVTCPVLLLRADPAMSPAISDDDEAQTKAALADLTVVRFAGIGHPISPTKPDLYARVVTDFLESLE